LLGEGRLSSAQLVSMESGFYYFVLGESGKREKRKRGKRGV
jgi:hypothetical protein